MGAINNTWHENNRTAKNPTMDQRIAWHTEHAQECGCRQIPVSVQAEIQRRQPA